MSKCKYMTLKKDMSIRFILYIQFYQSYLKEGNEKRFIMTSFIESQFRIFEE